MASQFIEDGHGSGEVLETGDKPIVFLLGDSIRLGYCKTVKEVLEPEIPVVFPNENCRSTQFVIPHLCGWSKACDREKVKVFHFNCGHWDVAHWDGDERSLTTPDDYAYNLGRIIRHARDFFPNATFVFATTTPMDPRGRIGRNPRSNEEIDRYNEIARKVCAEYGVLINDLNSFARGWDTDSYIDYCHYTPEKFRLLGEHVADVIKGLL